MQCPKELKTELEEGSLTDGLTAHKCSCCEGAWIRSENYEAWQLKQNAGEAPPADFLPSNQDVDFTPSPYDGRASLCPECKNYLVRSRITLQDAAFYLERCPSCQGVWCDRNEWKVLEDLSLAAHIPYLFTDEWQIQVRQLEAEAREQRATKEKLGPEIAAKIFELAKLLENHPNGDFGVAYLMRRFEE